MLWSSIISMLLAVCGVLLMFVILLQRGRGGGLAGAFGGLGGQSAFGTKAGDVFTRITIGMAVVWVALAATAGFAMRWETQGRFQGSPDAVPKVPGMEAPQDDKASGKEGDAAGEFNKEPAGDDKAVDAKGGPTLPNSETKAGAAAEKPETKTPAAGATESKPAESKPADAPKGDAPKPDAKGSSK